MGKFMLKWEVKLRVFYVISDIAFDLITDLPGVEEAGVFICCIFSICEKRREKSASVFSVL